ncbi:PREDICTED: NTPase KAP family P-loop domain-containing protein 1 [Myotis davidii]|uniref:NTPase KAP family P-loop domain-containing protein 1 n=1 Tax=Myotis davidii TaxID=225400 RepID=UPI000767C98D|nr:PREDICTED: NTPase KAP family P-loop domain-containing protein 1 [Myotis davidii]
MHQHYTVHFTKGTLPPRSPTESYFLDPELGHQKGNPTWFLPVAPGVRDPGPVTPTSFLPGCCQQWCHDPAALPAHRPYQLSPQVWWQVAYHSHQGCVGGCRWGPQPPILQQQRQPHPAPSSPLRQHLCPVPGAQKGPPTATTAPKGPACAPQLPPAPTTAPTMASRGPALPSATSIHRPTDQATEDVWQGGEHQLAGQLWLWEVVHEQLQQERPFQTTAVAEGLSLARSFGSQAPSVSATHSQRHHRSGHPEKDILTEDDVYCSCLAKTLCHVPVPVTVGFYAAFGCRLHLMLDKITGEDLCVLGAATTLSGSGLLMAVFSVGKHLFVSQRKKIERLVSQEKFGSQLGFMCEVKKEVELLTDFLCFLEIYQRRRLRVVLEITGLDTCYSEHVVGVLNAINTLLSDCHAPFIFILVVDPSILAACLESSGSMKGTADNGYVFLNRTVTLPFSVPIMGHRTKLQFLHDAVQSRDDLLYREMTPASLWDVFRDNSSELHSLTKELHNVLDLDGDPELFQRFLSADFPFTVAEAQNLLRCTVNLDHSIRRRMGLLLAVKALKPPSPPKSPAGDAPHAANGANHTPSAASTAHGASHGASHDSRAARAVTRANQAREVPHPRDMKQRHKPRPVA